MKQLLFSVALLMAATPACAETYRAVQGDMLTIEKQLPDGAVTLHCFGKSWPVIRTGPGMVRAWIGVDMKTSPGSHALKWSVTTPKSGTARFVEKLSVSKGEFRVSHITVDRKMAVFGKEELKRIRADQQRLKNSYVARVDARPELRISGMPVEGIMSTPFGAQRYVNGEARSPHSGIDIAAAEGTPVVTPLAGRVLVVSKMYLNGNTVAIGHGYGVVSVFSHLKTATVKEGDWIEAGSNIGEVGQTGRATGPHLHWGVRFRQARINPESMLVKDQRQ
ncbi:MAG: M23 family metallopeptidase [Mariprofundaceae bacterium]|nr:M23 family metallopeptidase [Mariprofundaceae bacterium]